MARIANEELEIFRLSFSRRANRDRALLSLISCVLSSAIFKIDIACFHGNRSGAM